ncbi:MAG: hypothetical protein ACLT98_07290 [Eggerthellaceae bacterium]
MGVAQHGRMPRHAMRIRLLSQSGVVRSWGAAQFVPAADGMEGWTNPRAFFLAGILATSVLFAAFLMSCGGPTRCSRLAMLPRTAHGMFRCCVSPDLFDSTHWRHSACAWRHGLFLLVMPQPVLARATVLLRGAEHQIGALFAKLVLVEVFEAPRYGSSRWAAVALPVVSTSFEASAHCGEASGRAQPVGRPGIASRSSRAHEFGIPSRPRVVAMGRSEKRDLMAIVAVAAILLVVRAMSFLGMWAISHEPFGFDRVGVEPCPAACAWCFRTFRLDRCRNAPFHPLSARHPRDACRHVRHGAACGCGSSRHVFSIVVRLDELFAHLLFWCVVIAALDALDVPSYRVVLACAVYAAVSRQVVLMSRVTVVDTALVLLTAYAVVVFAMRVNWRRIGPAQRRPRCRRRGRHTTDARDAASATVECSPRHQAAGADATARLHAPSRNAATSADAYGLSPRERGVFACMARGRTRGIRRTWCFRATR